MKQQNNWRHLYQSLGWTAGIYALTAFHHYYGSVVYGTPWRTHVVYIGGIALLLCFLPGLLYRRFRNKLLLNGYLVIGSVLFSLLIGLVEGFYNHTIKDLLYFSGMNAHTWRSLFPAPAYEVPDNIVFESTGILQFPVGMIQFYSLYKVYKAYKKIDK
ncbi:hypothetical protein ACTHGU_04980 [Chitinophagaceae bacterium MMS25-I14]